MEIPKCMHMKRRISVTPSSEAIPRIIKLTAASIGRDMTDGIAVYKKIHCEQNISDHACDIESQCDELRDDKLREAR